MNAVYGADPTGTEDSTSAFQAAIDAAGEAGGGTVAIGAGSYRLDGVLTVSHDGVVLTGSGPSTTELFFTLGDGMTDRSHVSFTGEVTTGDDLLLTQDAAPFDTVVHLDPTDAATLSVGDEVGVGWVIRVQLALLEQGMELYLINHRHDAGFIKQPLQVVDLEITDADAFGQPLFLELNHALPGFNKMVDRRNRPVH